MKRLLVGLLILAALALAGCGSMEGKKGGDLTLTNGPPQVEMTVQR